MREKLIELLKDSPSLDALDDEGYAMGADHLIANGVRTPVFCKDCEMEYACRVAQWLGEDGYCSYGERREDNG